MKIKSFFLVLIIVFSMIMFPANSAVVQNVYELDVVSGEYYAFYSPDATLRPFYFDGNGNTVFVQAYRWDLNNSYIIFQAPISGTIYLREEPISLPVLDTKSWFSYQDTIIINITGKITVNDVVQLNPDLLFDGHNIILFDNNSYEKTYSLGVFSTQNYQVTVNYVFPYNIDHHYVIANARLGYSYQLPRANVDLYGHYNSGNYWYHRFDITINKQASSATITFTLNMADAGYEWGQRIARLEITLTANASMMIKTVTNGVLIADNGNRINLVQSLNYVSLRGISGSYDYFLYGQDVNLTLWTAEDVLYPLLIPIDTTNISSKISNPNPVLYIPSIGLWTSADVINYGNKESFLIAYNPHINPANVTIINQTNVWLGGNTTIAPHLWDWSFGGGYVLFDLPDSWWVNYTEASGVVGAFVPARDYNYWRQLFFQTPTLNRFEINPFVDEMYWWKGVANGTGGSQYALVDSFDSANAMAPTLGRWVETGYSIMPNNGYWREIVVKDGTILHDATWDGTTIGPVSTADYPSLTYYSAAYTYIRIPFHQNDYIGSKVSYAIALYGASYTAQELTKITTIHQVERKPANMVFLDATFFNGTHYFDLMNSSVVGVPYGGVARVPAEQKWLWVVYNATGDGLVHLKYIPKDTIVRFYNSSDNSLVLELRLDGSSDVPINLPEGTYNVEAVVPMSSLEFPAEIIWNYPIKIDKPALQYTYKEMLDVLSLFPVNGTAEQRTFNYYNENGTLVGSENRILFTGDVLLRDYVGATIVMDLQGNYTAYGVEQDTIGSTDRSWNVFYVVNPNAHISGNFSITKVLVLWNTRVHTHVFTEITSQPSLRSYPVYQIKLVSGTITGTWSYRVPVYITLSELPQRLDAAGFVFRIKLPVDDWISAGLLSPAMEDLLLVDSNMDPLSFYIYEVKNGYATVYVRYDKPIMSNTLVIYVLLQNKQLWNTGNSFSSATTTFDIIQPSEFRDDFGYTDTATYLAYNYYIIQPLGTGFGFKLGKTWYDFIAYSNGEVWEQHGSIKYYSQQVRQPSTSDIQVYISRSNYDDVLVYDGDNAWFSVRLSEFNASKAYYFGYMNAKVYVARTLLHTYSIGTIVGGLTARPTVTISQPPPPAPQPQSGFNWGQIMSLIPLILLAVVIRLIKGGESERRPRGEGLPW